MPTPDNNPGTNTPVIATTEVYTFQCRHMEQPFALPYGPGTGPSSHSFPCGCAGYIDDDRWVANEPETLS